MSGPGQPTLTANDAQTRNGPSTNYAWITDFNFSDAALYNTIGYTYSNYPNLNQLPGRLDDWIEIYNTTTETIQLDGWHLTDDVEVPAKWTFPSGTSLDSGDGVVVKIQLSSDLDSWTDLDPSLAQSTYLANHGLRILFDTPILPERYFYRLHVQASE